MIYFGKLQACAAAAVRVGVAPDELEMSVP